MRERERLEDFRGGHVACRGCKRLIWFEPDGLAQQPPVVCCAIAYVPARQQVDLLIWDRLQPGDVVGAVEVPEPPPLEVPPDEDEPLPEPAPGPPDVPDETEEPGDVSDLVVTPEEAEARYSARLAAITARQQATRALRKR